MQQPLGAVEPSEERAEKRIVADEAWSLTEVLREDFRRHGSSVASAGFRALAVHRLLRWRRRLGSPLLRRIVGPPLVLAWRYMRSRHRIELPVSAVIGRRVRLSDLGDICLGAAVVGDDCDVGPGVTVGLVSNKSHAAPRIGSRVTLGPGVLVAGDIEVGDEATVGPHSVVVGRVPAGATVRAEPARPDARVLVHADERPPTQRAADDRGGLGQGGGASGAEPASPGSRLLALLHEDRRTHGGSWLAPGFQALTVYRIRHRTRSRSSLSARVVHAGCGPLEALVRSRHHIALDCSAKIGRRVRLARDGRIAILGDSVVADGCRIEERVIVGWHPPDAPPDTAGAHIGGDVRIAAGSLIARTASIGRGAQVGTNALVAGDVPDGALTAAPAAKVLRIPRPRAS